MGTDKTDIGDFLIQPSELTLKFAYPEGVRRLGFAGYEGSLEAWREECKAKLSGLLVVATPSPCAVRVLRQTEWGGVSLSALVMQVDETLSLPAYLLHPARGKAASAAVMAIHGHGEAAFCIGAGGWEDYHHNFALGLAQAGHTVLCPALRGFGALGNLAAQQENGLLDYWREGYRQFTLVTDGFQKGRTLLGDTVEDLLRWEDWLARGQDVSEIYAVGISYGGDLALTYPVFSHRVRGIFASGTLGSFAPIFARCYNAPAHCIPGILEWMDRADIAGLNAPTPITLHYGELDVPGPSNASASYNETVPQSVAELKAIYAASDAGEAVQLVVSMGRGHEMDLESLLAFLPEPH